MTIEDTISEALLAEYPEVLTRERRARALVLVATQLEELPDEKSALLLKEILPDVDLAKAYRACADVRQHRRDPEQRLEFARAAVAKLYVHEPQHRPVP